MSAGGWDATFQGLVVTSFQVRRGVGLTPDASVLQVYAPSDPTYQVPNIDETGKNAPTPALPLSDLSDAVNESPIPDPVVGWRGALRVREGADSELWPADAPWVGEMFYVSDVTRDPTSEEATITLLDVRALWQEGGFLTRWEFNLYDREQAIIERTTNSETGRPYTLTEIASYLVSRLPGGVTFGGAPARWAGLTPTLRFAPLSLPVDALAEVLDKFPARLVLQWGGAVSFWEPGEQNLPGWNYSPGQALGEAPPEDTAGEGSGRRAAVNTLPLPELWESVTEGFAYAYPPEYAVVAGGERVASVAIDYWEPVLQIDGEFWDLPAGLRYLLSGKRDRLAEVEDQIRKIEQAAADTPGGFIPADSPVGPLREEAQKIRADARATQATPEELGWLQRFILRRGDYQSLSRKLTAAGIEILRRDAYKLWRMPGADTYRRHLLPLLDRAETDGRGVRLRPTAYTYRYRFAQRPITGSAVDVPAGDATTTGGAGPTEGETRYAQATAALTLTGDAIRQALVGSSTGSLSPATSNEVEEELRGGTFFRAAYAKIAAAANEFFPVVSVPETIGLGGLLPILEPTAGLQFGVALPEDEPIALDATGLGGIPASVLRIVGDKQGDFGAGVAAVVEAARQRGELARTTAERTGGELLEPLIQASAARGLAALYPALLAEAAELPSLAQAYRDALTEQTAAAQLISAKLYTLDLEVKLAEALISLGAKARELRNATDRSKALRDLAAPATVIVEEIITRIETWRRAAARGETAQQVQTESYPLITFAVNDPRAEDKTAQFDADLGTVRFPSPVGHLDRVDVATDDGQQLIPRPVRVVFGVTVGPPRARTARATTGDVAPGVVPLPGDEDVGDIIPPQVRNASEETAVLWLRAFARDAAGDASEVQLGAVPAFAFARPIEADDLRELITLSGASNAAALLARSYELAAAAFRVPNTKRQATRAYLRPWRVDCDGVVTGVEVQPRAGGIGLQTIVHTGLDDRPWQEKGQTRERPRRAKPERPGKIEAQ